jgi:hypothetical protein
MRPEDLIGTWSLESFTAKGSNGAEGFPFGESPQGLLTYTASGHMVAVLMRSGRPKFASGDLRGGNPEEIKEAFEGFEAYAGPYELDEKSGTVTHHAQISRFPNWEGTAQVRYAKLVGDELHLTTPPTPALGQDWVLTLSWRRVSPR